MAKRLLETLAWMLLPVAACIAQPLQAEPAPAAEKSGRWLEATSEHFVVYSRFGEQVIRDYIGQLEDFDRQLRVLLGSTDKPAGRKLPIYLLSELHQMRRTFPGAGATLAGYYFAGVDDIFAVAIRQYDWGSEADNGDDIILHEYTHHFMKQYFPASYPAWMVEGLAEYYMTIDMRPTKVTVGGANSGRADTLSSAQWLPMDEVLRKTVGDLKGQDIFLYYAQSWLLTHYVWSDTTRRKQLADFLALVRDGTDPVDAWSKVYGDSPEALKRKLQAYLGKRLSGTLIAREPPPPPQIVFKEMPAGADDLILEAQQLKLRVAEDQRPKLLETIRAAAAKHPGERYSRRILARAEIELGDRARGRQLLETLLAEQPQDLEALQLMAFGNIEQARNEPDNGKALRTEAVRYLTRAHKIDPDHYLTLYGYALARSGEGELSDNTLDAFYQAATLAPQCIEIRMNAASAFLHAKDYASAREMLEPVATNPHGGNTATQAQSMLKSIPSAVKPD